MSKKKAIVLALTLALVVGLFGVITVKMKAGQRNKEKEITAAKTIFISDSTAASEKKTEKVTEKATKKIEKESASQDVTEETKVEEESTLVSSEDETKSVVEEPTMHYVEPETQAATQAAYVEPETQAPTPVPTQAPTNASTEAIAPTNASTEAIAPTSAPTYALSKDEMIDAFLDGFNYYRSAHDKAPVTRDQLHPGVMAFSQAWSDQMNIIGRHTHGDEYGHTLDGLREFCTEEFSARNEGVDRRWTYYCMGDRSMEYDNWYYEGHTLAGHIGAGKYDILYLGLGITLSYQDGKACAYVCVNTIHN